MRTLSATLLAEQRSASARPYLRVRLFDRDAGTIRLRWQRWYEGSEPDGPCGAAVPADGSLLRARIDPSGGALSHQRVASPSESSDFTSWTSLGTVAVTPRLGLSAAGTRAMLATVRSDGVTVEVRESTDSGAGFGSSSAVATAGATATAVSCALQSDGSAAVLYAVSGVVYAVTRAGTGAWSSPQAWTLSLASVSALAAHFQLDYSVLVSGATAAGDQGVWATTLGVGGQSQPGNWSPLAELAAASSGTSVSYLATGAALAGVPRGLFVESYSGGGAYDRVHIAGGVALSAWFDFLWRDPRPFEHASPHGLAVAADGGDAWLCSPGAVWHAAVSAPVTDLSADVLEADLEQGLERGRLRLVLSNDDGRYNADRAPAALAPGGELLIGPGYETTAGAETSEGPRFWITSLRRRRRGASSAVELEAVDGWGLLRAWTASRQLTWSAGGDSAFQVLRDIARRAGLTAFLTNASVEATTLRPAFAVRAGENGATAVSRLLEMLPDVLVVSGVDAALTEVRANDSTDYAYGASQSADGHIALELRAGDRPVPAGWARVFGDGVFAEAVDEAALRDGASTAIAVDDNLTAQPRADARAATLLRQAALAAPRGELVARANVGQEVNDVITIADESLGMRPFPYAFPLTFPTVGPTKFRVAALRLRFARGRAQPRYDTTLTLTEV